MINDGYTKEIFIRYFLKDNLDENLLINMLWGFKQGLYQGSHKFSKEFLVLARQLLKDLIDGQEVDKWKP